MYPCKCGICLHSAKCTSGVLCTGNPVFSWDQTWLKWVFFANGNDFFSVQFIRVFVLDISKFMGSRKGHDQKMFGAWVTFASPLIVDDWHLNASAISIARYIFEIKLEHLRKDFALWEDKVEKLRMRWCHQECRKAKVSKLMFTSANKTVRCFCIKNIHLVILCTTRVLFFFLRWEEYSNSFQMKPFSVKKF
jgi:hypothetical protein